MKRFLIRLSALVGVIAVGVFAIVQGAAYDLASGSPRAVRRD